MFESEAQKSPCVQKILSRAEKVADNEANESDKKTTKVSTPRMTTRRPQSSPTKRSVSSSTYSEFEKACLKAHNEYRAKHCVAPLKLNRKLCRFADEWAKVSAILLWKLTT